jgi:hypothetical protein
MHFYNNHKLTLCLFSFQGLLHSSKPELTFLLVRLHQHFFCTNEGHHQFIALFHVLKVGSEPQDNILVALLIKPGTVIPLPPLLLLSLFSNHFYL